MGNEYTIREYRYTDVHAVVDMLNAGGHSRAVVDGAWNVRLIRYVPVTSKKAVAENRQGKIIGYAYVADKENSFIVETGGGVHPEYLNQGIGSILLNWAQEEAVRINQNAPAGVKCVLQANIFEGESEAIKLFEAEGFSKVREWAHYEIHLNDEPIKVALPEGMSICSFDLDNDWELVGPVMDAAFTDHWASYSLPQMEAEQEELEEAPQDFSYSNSEGYCFIMRAGDEIAGGILCNAKLVEHKNTGRIGSVFVHPNYRRRGVGKALMLAAFSAFHQNNVRRIILDTDSQSFTDSSKFYTSLGMNIYRREFLYEKETRTGREIRRLEK
ncbi:MAG: GNAT family N-acetyltransferase [Anaerolineales bacterium]|nr:GNAT family N-acetyltransferase [Anaerolineales bacterium]